VPSDELPPDDGGGLNLKDTSSRYYSPEEWKALVERIQNGDSSAEDALYRSLSGGARFFLLRRLGPSTAEDVLHDVYLAVLAAIRSDRLRQPERLMGFVRTILKRQVNDCLADGARGREISIDDTPAARLRERRPSPEDAVLSREKTQLMKVVIRELSARDAEILTRFYFRGQPEERIRAEMDLTPTQFRLLKSRAKARFTLLVQQRYGRRPINPR
jgi:RNA polymerase sigma-70 factor, ECF subfamily